MVPVHVDSGTSSAKVGAKYELAPDDVESATWLALNTNIGDL